MTTPDPPPSAKAIPLSLAVPLVLFGFAANSLLCRAALADGSADAATFTAVWLGTGCLVLALISVLRRDGLARPQPGPSLALAAYAFGFSWAYRQVTAGTGALLLFGAVQVTMLLVARLQGAVLPWRKWLGAAVAFAGLAVLCAPTAAAPPWKGAASMLLAGVAWGAYSLLGRGSTRPMADTAASFAGAALIVLPLLLGGLHATPRALLLATVSGTVASGVTYSLWYAVIPRLGALRAAVAQLAVPLIAAAGAALLLGEWPPLLWYFAAALVLAGIGVVIRR